MDLDSRVQLSYYEKVSEINEEHHISLVRHIKTGKIYVRKDLSVYNEQVYQELIKHPVKGIPRVYCAYEENQTLTIIEDYIAGETLDDMLNDGHTFSEMEVINIGIELSELLWKLHTQKPAVIHRDMKPSNVIIAPDGHPFILDLNASRISIPKTEDTDLIGTKGYAAPEQYGFGSSDQRTDIYALGMLMNALLCGHFSQEISVRASKRFRRILRICTKIDPYKRFKNMDILNEELTYLKEHYSWQRFLPPGFRNLKFTHAFPAFIGYWVMLEQSLTFYAEGYENPSVSVPAARILILLCSGITVFLTCDYLGVLRKLLPFYRRRNPVIRFVTPMLTCLFLCTLFFVIIVLILIAVDR